jgi:hypothetical protein
MFVSTPPNEQPNEQPNEHFKKGSFERFFNA